MVSRPTLGRPGQGTTQPGSWLVRANGPLAGRCRPDRRARATDGAPPPAGSAGPASSSRRGRRPAREPARRPGRRRTSRTSSVAPWGRPLTQGNDGEGGSRGHQPVRIGLREQADPLGAPGCGDGRTPGAAGGPTGPGTAPGGAPGGPCRSPPAARSRRGGPGRCPDVPIHQAARRSSRWPAGSDGWGAMAPAWAWRAQGSTQVRLAASWSNSATSLVGLRDVGALIDERPGQIGVARHREEPAAGLDHRRTGLRWRGVENGQEAQPDGRDTRGRPSGGDLGQPVAVAEPIRRTAQLGGEPLDAVLRRARHRVEQLQGQQRGSAHEPGRQSRPIRPVHPSADPPDPPGPPDPPNPVETRR